MKSRQRYLCSAVAVAVADTVAAKSQLSLDLKRKNASQLKCIDLIFRLHHYEMVCIGVGLCQMSALHCYTDTLK